MEFPKELWGLILSYTGPNKKSLELSCSRAGIRVVDYEESKYRFLLQYVQVTSTTDFLPKTRWWDMLPCLITIHSVQRDEKKCIFNVQFAALYSARIQSLLID